ncbi:hypothetical protein QEN19_000224 [Hanseniaspora menglaensis]
MSNIQTHHDSAESSEDDTNSAIVSFMNNEGPEFVMEHTLEVLAKAKEDIKQNTIISITEHEGDAAIEEDEDDDISHVWFKQTQERFFGKPWFARPSIAVILVVLVLRVLCITLLMTPTIGLLSSKLCDEFAFDKSPSATHGGVFDKHRCDMKAVQKEQSNITSLVTLINSVVGMILGGKYGEFADRLGRVFVLKLVGFIGVFHIVLMLFAFYPTRAYQRWIVMLAMTSDITGGILTLISIGNSYISDIISPSEGTLAVYISLLMSIVYGSLGFGPLLASYLIKIFKGNLIIPYYFTLILSVLYLIIVFCFVHESRHKDAQKYSAKVLKKNRLRRKSSISSVRSGSSADGTKDSTTPLKLSFNDRLYIWLHVTVIEVVEPIGKLWIARTATGSLIPRVNTILLIVVDTLFCSATSGFVPVLLLYSLVAYDWTSVELGYYISICGLGRSVVLFSMPIVINVLKKKLNFKVIPNGVDSMDKFLLNVSMIFLVVSTLSLIIFRQYGWSLYVSAALQTLSAVISPTIQSCILKYNSKKISGQVFAAHTQLRHLAMIFIPIIFLQTYSHTYDKNPMIIISIPFCLSATGLVLLQFVKLIDNPVLLRRDSEVLGFHNQSILENANSDSYGSLISVRNNSDQSNLNTARLSNNKVNNPSLDDRRPSILNRND